MGGGGLIHDLSAFVVELSPEARQQYVGGEVRDLLRHGEGHHRVLRLHREEVRGHD